jgi:hypothetical protein
MAVRVRFHSISLSEDDGGGGGGRRPDLDWLRDWRGPILMQAEGGLTMAALRAYQRDISTIVAKGELISKRPLHSLWHKKSPRRQVKLYI